MLYRNTGANTDKKTASAGAMNCTVLSHRSLAICIVLGAVLLFFTGGRWNIPVMAFVFSIPLLIITRNIGRWTGLIIVFIIICLTSFFKNPGILMSGFPLDQLASMVLGMPLILPFAADRFIAEKFIRSSSVKIQFLATLIFPLAFALYESLLTLLPTGYMYSLAVTQVDDLPLLQLASITGGRGIAFAVAWVAPLILFIDRNIRVHEADSPKETFRSLMKYSCIALSVFMLIFAFGGARLAFDKVDEDIALIAMASAPEHYGESGEWRDVPYEENISFMDNAIKYAVSAHAEMLVFSEESFGTDPENVERMKESFSAKAEKSGLYIVAGFDVYDKNGHGSNRVCMFSPDGEILYDYAKSILIPFVETGYEPGDGNIPVVKLKLGNNNNCQVSTAICFEGEYSHYMNSVDGDTDIHLNPSWEWNGSCDFHTQILKMRAVEHGTSLVKPTYDGLCVASDPLGRTITCSDSLKCGNNLMLIAAVPTHGVWTLRDLFKQ